MGITIQPTRSPGGDLSFQPGNSYRHSAFTLVEVAFSLAALALTAAGVFFGFNTINTSAAANRLYSEAQALAEQRIDAILTKGPFDPTQSPPKVPAELQLGQTTEEGVLVYVDPVTNAKVVTGERITTITDAGLTQTVNGKTTNLNVRRARVEVRYPFRSKQIVNGKPVPNYSVVMNTMRTADQ